MGMVHEPIEQREPWGNSLTYGRVVREEDDSQSTPEEDEWLTYCEEELTPNREQYLSLLKDCRGAKEEDDSQTKKYPELTEQRVERVKLALTLSRVVTEENKS